MTSLSFALKDENKQLASYSYGYLQKNDEINVMQLEEGLTILLIVKQKGSKTKLLAYTINGNFYGLRVNEKNSPHFYQPFDLIHNNKRPYTVYHEMSIHSCIKNVCILTLLQRIDNWLIGNVITRNICFKFYFQQILNNKFKRTQTQTRRTTKYLKPLIKLG